jgi:hypothetical protein
MIAHRRYLQYSLAAPSWLRDVIALPGAVPLYIPFEGLADPPYRPIAVCTWIRIRIDISIRTVVKPPKTPIGTVVKSPEPPNGTVVNPPKLLNGTVVKPPESANRTVVNPRKPPTVPIHGLVHRRP